MIAYARLTPGPGYLPVQALLYYAQRIVLWPTLRRLVTWIIAAAITWTKGAAHQAPPDDQSRRILNELNVDGVSLTPSLASASVVASMVDYFLQQPVVGPDGRACRLSELPEGVASAPYALQTVVDCPGLLALINSAWMLQLAALYIGCRPTISSLGVRWSFPTHAERPGVQSFHRDVDDWRFLKLFIYLTDVDKDSGPHCYVRTSHRSAFRLRSLLYRVDKLSTRFGPDKLLTITGRRGTTFLADTLGIHCGGATNSRPRLILQVQYSILPVFAFLYRPVTTNVAMTDTYANRLLITAP
ncbi:MAG: hypothetical protein JO111_01880 [Caulobacteraceae bacterium]|nr:hypothetical protein [Caulobacteraceae bacterium]